jgi:hypothetical protein
MDLLRGIKNDLRYIDGQATWRLTHHTEGTHDYAAGTFSATDVITDIGGCVKRSPADRQLQSTRQIQQRMESIQADELNVSDVVLEVPGGHAISEGDFMQELDSSKNPIGPRYITVSVDHVDFLSRDRVGCRTLK